MTTITEAEVEQATLDWTTGQVPDRAGDGVGLVSEMA